MDAKASFRASAFLISLARTYGILAVFEEARPVVVADKLDECLRLGLPILGEAFEVFEDGINASGREESHCILSVFVEVCVEDALILEVGLPINLEDLPAQIVQLEHREAVWILGNRFLNLLGMFVTGFLTAGNQLCDDGEAVTRGSPGEDRAVASLFGLAEVTSLRDRHRDGFRPVLLRCLRHDHLPFSGWWLFAASLHDQRILRIRADTAREIAVFRFVRRAIPSRIPYGVPRIQWRRCRRGWCAASNCSGLRPPR